MPTDTYPLTHLSISLLTFVGVIFVLPFLRHLHNVRKDQMDAMASLIREVKADVQGIEEKINGHVEWHLGESPRR